MKLDAVSCATLLWKLLTSSLLQYRGSINQHAGLFSGEGELNCKLQLFYHMKIKKSKVSELLYMPYRLPYCSVSGQFALLSTHRLVVTSLITNCL